MASEHEKWLASHEGRLADHFRALLSETTAEHGSIAGCITAIEEWAEYIESHASTWLQHGEAWRGFPHRRARRDLYERAFRARRT